MADPYETILFERSDDYAVVTLNRPDKLNAFNEAVHADLRAALTVVEDEDAIRALIITGAGRAFSSGQDLSDRVIEKGAPPRDLGAGLDRFYNPLVRRIRSMNVPVIAAINGVAAGAGCNVALSADIVLAARSARFIQAFVKIGLTLDAGGSYILPRTIGTARALGLALTGDPIDGQTAADWGLVWACHDDDKLMDEARALAAKLAAGSNTAHGLIKRAINAAAGNTLGAQLDLEAALQREAGQAGDYQEGVRAFLEKRPPNYKKG